MAGGNEGALVAAAIAGRPLSEIAKAGGVSVRTAQRRLKSPAIDIQVREGRARHRDETAGRLLAMRGSALTRLAEWIDSEDPHVSLRAINLCLRQGAYFDGVEEFDRRLRAVENVSDADAGNRAVADDDDGLDGVDEDEVGDES